MSTVLTMKQKIAYGAGDLGSNLVFQGLAIFIMIYWTNVAMIDPVIAGLILLVSRVFDGVTDLLIGRIVDKTESKHGKARPWILWLSVPFAISAMLTFWTPGSSEMINIIYAFVSYNVTMTIYTAINIPYGVLTAKITSDPVERGKLGAARSFAATLGIIIISGAAPVLLNSFGYSLAFLLVGLMGSGFLLVTFFGTRETVGNNPEDSKYTLKQGFNVLKQNTPWLIMLISGILIFGSLTLRMTITAFYATYNLDNPDMVAQLTIIGMPGMIIGMAMSPALFKRFGKINASVYSIYANTIFCLGFFILAKVMLSIEMIYIYLVISSLALGVTMSGFFPMIADTIEYGQWKTGRRVEGLTYSAASIGTKIGGGIGAALVGWVIGAYGFDATLPQQSEQVLAAIEFLFLWVAPIGLLLCALVLKRNVVDQKHEQISQDLKEQLA